MAASSSQARPGPTSPCRLQRSGLRNAVYPSYTPLHTKTAHVFGAVTLDHADFTYRFAEVFNGETFHEFIKQLVAKYAPRKIFLVIDNGPCHWLDDGKAWLSQNADKIELHRLPAYSPEFNPTEGVWKVTRKMATHNRFYPTTNERDGALVRTFKTFQRRPDLVAAH